MLAAMMDFRLSLRTVEGMSAFIGKLLSVVSPLGGRGFSGVKRRLSRRKTLTTQLSV
jgi:hypothetical protein